jgi:hypothetical protein
MFKIIGGDGKEYGPVTAEQLRQWIAEGRVNHQTLAQAEGDTQWKPLGQYPEFGAASAAGGTPPPPMPLPPVAGQPQPHVANYLVPAILSTICCCLPFGIVAIVFAAQVNAKLQAGDIQGARRSSANARTWCWLALLCGLIFSAIWLLLMRHHARGFYRTWRVD